MRSFAAITTMNQSYYDNIGHNMIETFINYWPTNVKLYVYTEGFDLPVRAPNIRTLDIFKHCNPGLQSFLDWRGDHYTRKFAYKAYAWMNATQRLGEDILIYLDADTETKQPVTVEWLDAILPEDKVLAYMYAVATGEENGVMTKTDNAETCIYFFNQRHHFAPEFMRRYTEIYETREIANRRVYRKSHDTWVMAECVRYCEHNGVEYVNLHPDRDRRTPLKATILQPYFAHYKGKSKYIKSLGIDELAHMSPTCATD